MILLTLTKNFWIFLESTIPQNWDLEEPEFRLMTKSHLSHWRSLIRPNNIRECKQQNSTSKRLKILGFLE